MSNPAEPLLDLIGAASLPLGPSQVNASAPLARLTATSEGITVVLRSSLMSTFFSLGTNLRHKNKQISWSSRWGQIDRALVAGRSVVFRKVHGRGCRFAMRRASNLQPLKELLAAQGVKIEEVRSTALRAFRL